MVQSGNTDLTEDTSMITIVTKSGERFGSAKFADFQSITINGVAATITDLNDVRAVLAPFFFSVGNGGFAFSTIVELTPTLLTTQFSIAGIQLLPAFGSGLYPEFEIDFVNMGNGSEAFAGGNVFEVKSNTSVLARFDTTFLTTAGPTPLAVLQVKPSQLQGVNARYQNVFPNTAIMLNTVGSANYTISNVANGSRVFAQIKYNVRSFA